MPTPGQSGDFTLQGKPYLLARLPPEQGRAWERVAQPDIPTRRTSQDVKFGNLPDAIEHPAVYDDWSGGYGFAYRRPERPNVVHWSENFDLRFPNQATHCQQLQLLPARYASTRENCEYLMDVPLPGVNVPPAGAGAVLALGKGYIASYVPTNLNTVGSMFDRLYEATGSSYGRRPATFGSFTYIGNLDNTNFVRRSNDGLSYSTGPQPAQVIMNSGDRLNFLWKGAAGTHLRTVGQGADPMNSANFSATVNIGPGHLPPLDAVDRSGQVYVGLANGLHAGDTSATFFNVLPDLAEQQNTDNCRDLAVFNGEVQVPHVAGMWSFQPRDNAQAMAREVGPGNHGDRSPVHGRARTVTALGPWVYSGYWTGSQSYVLAGRDQADGTRHWTIMQRLPNTARVHRIHFDGITSSSSGQEIPQRMWVSTDASLTGTAPLYVSPIPRGNDNPLAPDPTFTANYCGSARMDLGRDDWGAPGTPKVYRNVEVWADLMLSGVRYADVFYQTDGGLRTYIGRAQDSPKSTVWFNGLNGNFITGQDIEISLESYTASLNVAPIYRSVVVRGTVCPPATDVITAVARIADNLRDRHGAPMRSGAQMLAELRAFAAAANPIQLGDLSGAANWVKVQQGIEERESHQDTESWPEILATVKMAVLDFTNNQSTTWSGFDSRTWDQVKVFTWAQAANQPWG